MKYSRLLHNKKEIMNSILIIIGEGPVRHKLKKLIKRRSLEHDIILLGFQKNPYKFLAKSDIFVLSSLYEGFPNVLLEAMSCGLPVICRDLEGISNFLIFPGKNGYLFSDYESFKFAFLNLYSDLDKCQELGRFSRTIIEKDHSFEKLYQTVFQK